MPQKQFKAKELAKIIRDEKLPWIVNENYLPDDIIHLNALGIVKPKGVKAAKDEKRTDLTLFINDQTKNPYLLERRKALGFITDKLKVKKGAIKPAIPKAFKSELSSPASAPSVDWRMRWGTRWITLPKDQNPCESCWAFAAAGVVESMTRIEHFVWSLRSEGDLRDRMGLRCSDGTWPNEALVWIKNNGLADPGCYPYYNYDHTYTPTPDRVGRTVLVPDPVALTTLDDQKTWLDTVGPITMCFEIYHDFDGYGGGIYVKSTSSENFFRGLHVVMVVGYDDSQQCWICKNSWGMNWGESWNGIRGYFRIRYGETMCDYFTKYGVHYTCPDPWTKRRLHNGNILEGNQGKMSRNLDMLLVSGKNVQHFTRNEDSGIWSALTTFGSSDIGGGFPSLISTTNNRSLECVYLTTGKRLHHWWLDSSTGTWTDGGLFGPTDTAGVSGFIQSNYGTTGNLEIVVRTADGKLDHWTKDSEGWKDNGRFSKGIYLSGYSLIQTTTGVKGNFELVGVCENKQMRHFWRDNDHGGVWNPGVNFGANIETPPVMIQGQTGATDENSPGNFELCVACGGVAQNWCRDNNGWRLDSSFGSDVQSVIGLLHGSSGFVIECILKLNTGSIQHWWKDSLGWHAGVVIA